MELDCMQIRDLMPLVASGQADAETRRLVAAHVAGCRECAHYYQQCIRDMPEAPPLEALCAGTAASAPNGTETQPSGSKPRGKSLLLLPFLVAALLLLLYGMTAGQGRFTPYAAASAYLSATGDSRLVAAYEIGSAHVFLFDQQGDAALLCAGYRFPFWRVSQADFGTWNADHTMQALSLTLPGAPQAADETKPGFTAFAWQSHDPAVAYVEWRADGALLRMEAQQDANGRPLPVCFFLFGEQPVTPPQAGAAPLIIAYDAAGQALYQLRSQVGQYFYPAPRWLAIEDEPLS